MLTVKGRLFGRKIQNREVVYEGFSLGDTSKKGVLAARYTRNCDCLNGVLKQNVGLAEYTLNDEGVRVSADLQANLFTTLQTSETGEIRELLGYFDYDNRGYLYNPSSQQFAHIGTLSGGVTWATAIDSNGAYKPIFVCDFGIHVLRENTLGYCIDTTCQPAACFLNGRIFTVSKDFWLVYSQPFAPEEYGDTVEESGQIALRADCGKIVGLVGLKNRLCVAYEYGFSMIELAGSARAFVRKDIVYRGGRIFRGTVCVANVGGERACFLAEDGVYAFDGVKAERLCRNLSITAVERYPFTCAVISGKYLVTYTDDKQAWRTVAVDLESGEGCETFAMRGLWQGEGKAVCVSEESVYRVSSNGRLPEGESAVFALADNDFSIAGNKTLRALRFYGDGAFALEARTKDSVKRVRVTLQNGEARVKIGLRGESFGLKMTLFAGAKLRGMTAELQTLE